MSDAALNEEWEKFCENDQFVPQNIVNEEAEQKKNIDIPKCSDIYISTKTKIAYLNQPIKLLEVFWKIPIIKYYLPKTGVIKKQIKINMDSAKEVEELEDRLSLLDNCTSDIITKVNNPNARKIKFKDVRKINIGMCKKDLTSYRKKKRGAFYNCFVLLLRMKYQDSFKEIHIKIFNTGKLEIPGIQKDELLIQTLDKLVEILRPFVNKPIEYDKDDIETVLINSNFECGYEINRNTFYNILKYKYNLNVTYDPCSYPGIQCKYYYNKDNPKNNGVCNCGEQCSKKGSGVGINQCLEISFMIFRTGSVLIVGHCDEDILKIIYEFLKKILQKEYLVIRVGNGRNCKKKKSVKKVHKRVIILTK